MAKVFAVIENDQQELELLSWSSKKAFESENGWLDERFIYIASTDDHKDGMYCERKELKDGFEHKGLYIILSDTQVKAYNMLVDAFASYSKANERTKKRPDTVRVKRLRALVDRAGSERKAVELIESVKGVAPTSAALHKALNGATTTDYVIECYIADLQMAFRNQE